jgi:glycine/D-amino acid oxidase-like deaminating enzyme
MRKLEPVMGLLKHAEVDQIAGGVPTYTNDYHFIADAVPGKQGLYVITGCQEAGVTHGPGLGSLMAQMVTGAKPTWDREPYRLGRFKA